MPTRSQTDWAKEALIEAIYGSDHAPGLPSTWYIALLTAPVVPADGSGTVSQPSQAEYPGYAPIAYANNDAHWTVIGGVAQNACVIAFTSPSVAGSTVLAPYWAVMTAPSVGGNVMSWGAIPVPQTVGAASVTPQFPVGTLRVSAVDPPDLST